MCNRCKPNGCRKVDFCMQKICEFVGTLSNLNTKGRLKIVASCCGHGKYPPSIIVRNHLGHTWDLITNIVIRDRKKRFYKKDKQGYYYIPEVLATLNASHLTFRKRKGT